MVAVPEVLRPTRAAEPAVLGTGLVLLVVALVTGWGIALAVCALLVPMVVAVAQRPQRGVLAFCALLPFDGIIKQFAPGWTNPWKQVIILGLLLLTMVCPEEARGARGRRWPSWLVPFLVLLALGLVSVVQVDRQTALVGLRLSYFSALFGLVIWRCPLDRRDRDHLVSIFVLLAIVTSAVGLWQQVVGHQYLHDLGYPYDDTIRFTSGFTLRSFSTFNQPFAFGFYLMLAILIALPMSLAEPRRLRSRVFFVSLPLIGAALLYTFVRGAMLGLAVGLLYLAFHRYKYLVSGIPLVLVVALLLPTGGSLTNAVLSPSSLGDRTLSWTDRLDRFADNPLGTGIGTTGAAAEKAAQLDSRDPNATYVPDNSWLKVLFELGVFGLWFFVLWIVAAFLAIRRTEARVEGIDRDFLSGMGAQMVAIMAASLVATYFELVPMDQLLWVMITVPATMAPSLRRGPPIHRPQVGPRARRAAFVA